MSEKKGKIGSNSSKRAPADRHAPLSKGRKKSGDDFAAVKCERDAFARQILDRLMPEFGPIAFTKAELFEEMSAQPAPDELIRHLAAESER